MGFSYSQGLWVSDGTEAGTHHITILEKAFYSMVTAGDKVFFAGSESVARPERIFVTDGTVNGTKPVSDSVTFYYVEALYGADNRVFISERYDVMNYLLYSFDVNQNGFGIIHPLFDKVKMGETPGPQCIGVNGRLGCTISFIDTNTMEFSEVHLWMSDGSFDGTRKVVGNFSMPGQMEFSGPELSFTANVIGQGRQIWVTDGTEERTRQLSHFSQKMCGSFSLTFLNGTYFLPLNDSGSNPAHGCELWALNLPIPRAFLPVITH
jgi:ELWxxDGT repeat protein